MTCKTCKYLDVPLNKAGIRATKDWVLYECIAPEPALPPLPDSFSISRMMVGHYGGEKCPIYSKSQSAADEVMAKETK